MSGETNSLDYHKTQAKLATKQAEEVLDRREAHLGIPQVRPADMDCALENWLCASSSDLSKKTPEELALGAISLRQAAFWLQKEQNRLQANLTRLCEVIDKIVAFDVVRRPGWTREERLKQSIEDNEEAKAHDCIRHNTLLELERIRWLVARIDSLATALLSLYSAKKGIYGKEHS